MRSTQSSDAEERAFSLLVACADWPATSERNRAITAASKTLGGNWDDFVKLAERHHLAIRVVQSLNEAGITPAPGLVDLANRQKRRALRLAGEALRVIELLEQEGVASAFLKGPLLSLQLYGDPAMRQCVDVDILVSWPDFRRSVAVLRERGYVLHGHEPPWDDWRIEPWRMLAKDVTLVDPEIGIGVELHHRLKSPESLLPSLGLAQASQMTSFAGRNLRTFERRDLFLYLCVHAATSFWDRLKWLADIRALLNGMTVAEIEAWQTHSHQHGTERCTALGLLLCNRLWGQPIPRHVEQWPQTEPWMTDLIDTSIGRLRGPERTHTSVSNSFDRRRLRELRSDQVYRKAQLSELVYDHELLTTVRLPRAMRMLYIPLRLLLFIRRKLGLAKDPRLFARN